MPCMTESWWAGRLHLGDSDYMCRLAVTCLVLQCAVLSVFPDSGLQVESVLDCTSCSMQRGGSARHT